MKLVLGHGYMLRGGKVALYFRTIRNARGSHYESCFYITGRFSQSCDGTRLNVFGNVEV